MNLSPTLKALAAYRGREPFMSKLRDALVPIRVASFYWDNRPDVCNGTYSGRHFTQQSRGGLVCYCCQKMVV